MVLSFSDKVLPRKLHREFCKGEKWGREAAKAIGIIRGQSYSGEEGKRQWGDRRGGRCRQVKETFKKVTAIFV
ncbi:hypothetical protein CJ030_MR5G023515 [Morella rubra]|uniref:Uncharacterized protein n=1 Tax=Morella rubra TaxID=262757 RepID=A0A6A1VIF4_9ROSI|nr:hypothetical protein CJ030_MR5G023515 [Morella rubra]